jgi:AAA ATPase family protein
MVFADKLLAFKDDRQALIVTFQRIYAELGMDLPTLDSGDSHDVGLAVNVIGRISS